MIIRPAIALAIGTAALAACTPPTGPVEVTRFHEPATLSQLGNGTIFVESAPGGESGFDENSLELSVYKAAVAEELSRLGYRETDRGGAGQIAQVRLGRYVLGRDGRRSPVSVGVGGSTGTYGSGVGLGIGINLGGGSGEEIVTELGVTIRDKASSRPLWEGRANFEVDTNSPLADARANADAVAEALFRKFPGNSGETVAVEVD